MEQEYDTNQFIEKKQFYFSIITLIILTVTLFLATYMVMNNKIDDTISNISKNDTPVFEEVKEEKATVYTVKEYNEKIAVYENNSLIKVLDIYVFTLPEKDKELLSVGINASTKQELNKILENYY